MLRVIRRREVWQVTRGDVVLFETWDFAEAVLIAIVSAKPVEGKV